MKMIVQQVGYDECDSFFFVMDYEVFLISKILPAGCNEIESNIVNCRMYHGKNKMKKKVETKTQNEKRVEKDRDIYIFFSIKMNTHFHKQNYNDDKTKHKKYN